MFPEHRAHISISWNREGFGSVDQSFLVCEMVVPSNSRSARVACAEAIKTKNDRENRKIGYEGQIEGSYPVEK